MNENPLVLTFDVGTQSARAMLVDKTGQVLAKTQQSYERPYHSPQPGWAEQDADMYWDILCGLSRRLKEENPALWPGIIAVTATSIRATSICLGKDGRPVRSAVVWLDKRRATNLPPMPAKSRMAFKMAGITAAIDTIRNNMACNWIIHNEPEVWAKTHKFVLLSAYLNLRFCGNLVDSTSNTVGVVPYDSKTQTWMPPGDIRRCLYLLEDDKLIDLVKPGEKIGAITAEASALTGIPEGVPYVVTGADKACETLGLSCTGEDCAALSFGTTATIEVATDRYFSAVSVVPPYTSITGGYLPEVETFRGYWLISWFKKEFATKEMLEAEEKGCSAEELLNERLKEVPPGCDGLILQPTFTPDAVTPHAKGAIIGFSDVHTRIHLYRSIIEGVNFSLMEGLHTIEKKGKLKIRKLFVAGGGSRSSEICQITANMFGLPVYRTQTHEVCGVGSSIVAFVAMGVYPGYPEALKAMVHIQDEFVPDMAEHKTYDRLYHEVYCKIFENLSPLYEKLHHIIS